MGMVVQHNVSAMNANNAMTKNVSGLKKQTEKLSTGYNINRAADNAAGLAISEKMRSQIRGLTQATSNANDAISLIQTAEGGLQETEDIMQRMRELSVQSANGTYTDEDREQIQYEVDALKSEVDRIAGSTEYNEMKLLDGSLDGSHGSTGEYGPRYGTVLTAANGDLQAGTTATSSIAGVKVSFTTNASGKGGENAAWDKTGKTLTVNLAQGQSYSQNEIDELIKGANTQKGTEQSADIPEVSVKLASGVITANNASSNISATSAGARAVSTNIDLGKALVGGADQKDTEGYADHIQFTSNSYGADTRTIKVAFDVAAGKESVEAASTNTSTNENDYTRNGTFTVHLATGTEYSEDDIERIMAKEGLDYSVKLTDTNSPDGDVKLYANNKLTGDAALSGTMGAGGQGAGVFKDLVSSTGDGLTFQIGANGVEDQRLTVNVGDMSASALGIAGISVAKQDDANAAINKLDDAIKTVSTQRAKLGAVQNRLEHTVNSLNTANENMTASESQIRDTDMASEMIKYTKSNILQQASQSMLAQANQQPQGVLQLLG